MATQTKAALQAENAALRTELDTLRTQMRNMASVASAVNSMQRGERAPYVMPQWQKDRAAAMAAAKALAMQSRSSIKVQA